MKTTALVTVLLLTLGIPLPALSGGAIAGATEPTQILNNIQLAASYAEHAQQTVTQLQQYQTMLTNLVRLTPSELLGQASRQLWQDQGMTQAFTNLRNIVVNGQSMAYSMSNMESRFKDLHPGYNGYGNGTDFFKAYQNWSENTLGSVKNAVSLVTSHAENFASEQAMVQELANSSNSAQGQLQALQAGNQVGVAMIGQMQKLRQLQMAQMQAQNAYMAGQQSRQDSSDAQMQQYLQNAKTFKTDAYGKGRVLFK